jgi:hypothetical protein
MAEGRPDRSTSISPVRPPPRLFAALKAARGALAVMGARDSETPPSADVVPKNTACDATTAMSSSLIEVLPQDDISAIKRMMAIGKMRLSILPPRTP